MLNQLALISVDQFEAFITQSENRDKRFELIHGEIVEKVPTEEHGTLAARLTIRVGGFVETHDLGRIAVEPRHRMPHDEFNARLPDVAFTSKERALPLVKKGAVPQMPDLVIEIKSPDDTYRAMRERADYYLANGALMVWLVYPEKRIVEVVTADDLVELTINDVLDGGDILPGFRLSLRDLFDVT